MPPCFGWLLLVVGARGWIFSSPVSSSLAPPLRASRVHRRIVVQQSRFLLATHTRSIFPPNLHHHLSAHAYTYLYQKKNNYALFQSLDLPHFLALPVLFIPRARQRAQQHRKGGRDEAQHHQEHAEGRPLLVLDHVQKIHLPARILVDRRRLPPARGVGVVGGSSVRFLDSRLIRLRQKTKWRTSLASAQCCAARRGPRPPP